MNERFLADMKAVVTALRDAGFVQVQVFGELEERAPGPEDRRLCFVCVNGEGGQTPGQMEKMDIGE
jgi:hypothetical protein